MLPWALFCHEQARLRAAFLEAAATYADLVADLADRMGTMHLSEYMQAQAVVNEAHLLAAAAQDALQQHRTLHGCTAR